MENRPVPGMGARAGALILIIGIVAAALLLATPTATRAQTPCLPPDCRDEGGGGGGGGTGPPVAPDPPPVPPGDPGDPGDGDGPPPQEPPGEDGGGGDGGGNPPAPPPGPPLPPGPGGGTEPEPTPEPELPYTVYTCGIIAYCPEMADYIIADYGAGGGFLLSWSCRTYESCQGVSDPGDDGEDPPCEPTLGDGGVELECDGDGEHAFDWGYYIRVWAAIPPHRVRRSPFPRGMVTVPNEFDLLAEPWISESGGPRFDGTGFWSETVDLPDPVRDEPQSGDLKDYEIGVRWRRVGDEYPGFGRVPPHCFDFDERAWNLAAGSPPAACGRPQADGHVRVSHRYETASWGKPANGPRADLSGRASGRGLERQIVPDPWDLESYQVRVPTYWVVEWRDRWYAWEEVGVEWGDCGCWGAPGEPRNEPHRRGCIPPPGICVNPGEWYGQVGEVEYDWVRHDTGWYGIDLRDYGRPTWYETSYTVVSGGEFAGREWWNDPSPNVPTPIIEVQSVLEP